MSEALILFLLGNAIAWIWGASKLSSSIDNLSETTKRLDKAIENIDTVVVNHGQRIAVLEDRDARV